MFNDQLAFQTAHGRLSIATYSKGCSKAVAELPAMPVSWSLTLLAFTMSMLCATLYSPVVNIEDQRSQLVHGQLGPWLLSTMLCAKWACSSKLSPVTLWPCWLTTADNS